MIDIEKLIDKVPDFPVKGILFRDISPLLKFDFAQAVDQLSDLLSEDEWKLVDVIGGIESRGFIFASALAYKHKKGFVKIRKPNKLPNVAARVNYGLEYGEDSLEMQSGSGNIIIVDDLIATGGTLKAACELCEITNHKVLDILTLINLAPLNDFEWNGMKPKSVIEYETA